MPNINRMGTVYVPTGNPDTVNDSSLYRAGELGVAYDYNDRTYQIVQIDSGATAAANLALAATQILYWKDRSKYLVTNDKAQAIGGQVASTNSWRNEVAGILRNAATAGYYVHMLIKGRGISVKCTTSTFAVGDWVVSHTTSAQADQVSPGTAPTVQPIGKAAAARVSTTVSVDVDLVNIP